MLFLGGYFVMVFFFFFFQAEDGIRDRTVTGVQTCALPIFLQAGLRQGGARSRSPKMGRLAYSLHEHAADPAPGLRQNPAAGCRQVVARRRSEERRVGKECRSR